ncbi:MAG TPA: ornithine carbamoyltransferase [Candidatus Limnocylindrales bacterium]|nr:ornithine carbamoyltransferase [Candidatus Limnocylindrales bacterium]
MAVSMKGKDVISIHDLTREEVDQILDTAHILKMKQKLGEIYHPLRGKSLGMIFQKSSTRTRVSFEVGMWQLGGYALFLSAADLQLNRGETIADTAKNLSRYLDGIMIRTYAHQDVVDLAKYSSVPVINGLTDLLHPCQVLSDLFTIKEKKHDLAGLKLAYVGDGNNMAHSLMFGCSKMGMHIVICSPSGFEPDLEITRLARLDAAKTGASIAIQDDPTEAVSQADIVYTDVWTSMGMEKEHDQRLASFARFQLNSTLLEKAKSDALVMHCLPAHRGEEITDDVIDGPNSIVFDQAENRLHVQKAILSLVM